MESVYTKGSWKYGIQKEFYSAAKKNEIRKVKGKYIGLENY